MSSASTESRGLHLDLAKTAHLVVLTLFFASAGLMAFSISWNRHMGVDEVEHLHASYTVARGGLLYKDIWQAHNPLFYYLNALLIFPDDPVASTRAARALSFVLSGAQVLLAYFCASRLAGRPAGIVASGLLLLHTAFVNRGVDIRPDVAGALCVSLAFAVSLMRSSTLRRHCIEAILLSAGFLLSKKLAAASFAFGCLWLLDAYRERRPILVFLPVGVWIAPVALCVLHMYLLGNLADYLRLNVLDMAAAVSRDATYIVNAPTNRAVLLREAWNNPFFTSLLVVGIAYGLSVWRSQPKLTFGAYLCCILIVGLLLNPFPYAYNHLPILPTGSVLIGATVMHIAGRLRVPSTPLATLTVYLLCFGLAAISSLPFLAKRTAPSPVYARQLGVLAEINRLTDPDDAVFDQMGLYFRPAGHWQYMMNVYHLIRYDQGKARYTELEGMLREREVVAIILNYRTLNLLKQRREFNEFVVRHFVHYSGNILLQGTAIEGLAAGESQPFEALKDKAMAYAGSGGILVDGHPFTRGPITRGAHTITGSAPSSSGRLMLEVAAADIEPPREPQPLFHGE